MRIAIILDHEETVARKAQYDDAAEADPEQRAIAERIAATVRAYFLLRIPLQQRLPPEEVAVDLYDTPEFPRRTQLGRSRVEGVELSAPRYLYTLIGEPQ